MAVTVAATPGQAELAVVEPEKLGYSLAHWSVEDGLPQRVITSLAQTPDGYLWCGTTAGLLRFDGARFRLFSGRDIPELKDVEILELLCDSAGRLWIGGISGQIVVYDDGHFQQFGESDGVPRVREVKLGQDPQGDFWINGRSTAKLYRFREGRFEAKTWPGLKPNMIDRFRANAQGELWAVHEQERTLLHLTANGIQVCAPASPDGPPEFGRFFDLQDGSLAVDSTQGIYAFDGSNWKLRYPFRARMPGRMLDAVQDRLGNFWMGSYKFGLFFCETNGIAARVSLPDTAADTYIRCLRLDSEGNVWVGGSDGLYRLRRRAFRPQPLLVQKETETYSSAVVEDAKHGIWLIDNNGWYRPTGDSWTYVPHGHSNQWAWSAVATPDGSVLVGYALYGSEPRLFEQIKSTGERTILGGLPDNVEVMLASRTGAVWLGSQGLWKWAGGKLQRQPLDETHDFRHVQALAEDKAGRLFVGDQGNGLFQQTDRSWRKLTTQNDLGSDRILGLQFDPEGTLWIATSQGIARWKDGKWFAHEPDPVLYPWVRAIACDNQGYLWMISALGASRITLKSLDALADGRVTTLESEAFTRADGLPTLEGTGRQASLLVASDDRLWVATQKGFAVLDPDEWNRRRQFLRPAPIHIDSILVDDQPVAGIVPDNFRVPSDKHRVEIHFGAISLQGGKCSYRYRLNSDDDSWVDLGEQRVAVFHGLPPGEYRFQVTAKNKYSLQDEVGAAISFYVQPQWWQTIWFRVSAGAAIGLALWFSRAVTLRRVERQRQRREDFARQLIRSQEDERKRLAAELHDSLGQNLLVAKNQLFLLHARSPDPASRARLDQVSESVNAALEEARSISHNLRPVQLERLGLTKAIRAMVRQSSEATRIPIEARIDPVDGLFTAEAEINLYRILQEALSNVVKHAEASRIELIVQHEDHKVNLMIRDDGRGFDVSHSVIAGKEARGLGLSGFQERANLLHGTFECISAPGAGTTLKFHVPVAPPRSTP